MKYQPCGILCASFWHCSPFRICPLFSILQTFKILGQTSVRFWMILHHWATQKKSKCFYAQNEIRTPDTSGRTALDRSPHWHVSPVRPSLSGTQDKQGNGPDTPPVSLCHGDSCYNSSLTNYAPHHSRCCRLNEVS
jgi:hypothetical protein